MPRLQSVVARVLPAIEATIARLAGGSVHPRDMEQASRALTALTRTLRELNILLAQHNAGPDGTSFGDCDSPPEDMEVFRQRLALRIQALVAQEKEKEDEAQAGSGLPPDALK